MGCVVVILREPGYIRKRRVLEALQRRWFAESGDTGPILKVAALHVLFEIVFLQFRALQLRSCCRQWQRPVIKTKNSQGRRFQRLTGTLCHSILALFVCFWAWAVHRQLTRESNCASLLCRSAALSSDLSTSFRWNFLEVDVIEMKFRLWHLSLEQCIVSLAPNFRKGRATDTKNSRCRCVVGSVINAGSARKLWRSFQLNHGPG